MGKDKKKQLAENFKRVTGIVLKEWYDDYGQQPKQPKGIGNFNNIDWQIVHEQLMINTELLAKGKTSEGNLMVLNVGDFTDYEGLMSPEELGQLEDWGLITVIQHAYPIIEEDEYKNYETFKAKAAEIWNKPPQQSHETGMVDDTPYLRGREPES